MDFMKKTSNEIGLKGTCGRIFLVLAQQRTIQISPNFRFRQK
jgi:hypothetical protein